MGSRRSTGAASLAVAVVLAVAAGSGAQDRLAYLREPCAVRTVGDVREGERVPLLVVLPATGGTSEEMLDRLAPAIPLASYVALLPAGRPSSADYLPDFRGFVTAMDERILADVERAKQERSIDPERVYVLGFSLGGDTAWALAVRHPDLFRGAFVAGSRSSATTRSSTLATMRERHARFALAIGRSDDAARIAGITRARDALRGGQVDSELFTYEGAHQLPSDSETLPRALRFLFER